VKRIDQYRRDEKRHVGVKIGTAERLCVKGEVCISLFLERDALRMSLADRAPREEARSVACERCPTMSVLRAGWER
jgi:hypothetical protein